MHFRAFQIFSGENLYKTGSTVFRTSILFKELHKILQAVSVSTRCQADIAETKQESLTLFHEAQRRHQLSLTWFIRHFMNKLFAIMGQENYVLKRMYFFIFIK